MKHTNTTYPVLFIAMLSTLSCAENAPVVTAPDEAPGNIIEPTRISMSPETTRLLVEEMRELQKSMNKIVPALVAGEWKEISYLGKTMRDSYIMKDSLTKAELHELHESLPEKFQTLDHSFHESAGFLAEAAEKQNYAQASYYYYKMTEACVDCHSIYATHKFPEFLKPGNHQ